MTQPVIGKPSIGAIVATNAEQRNKYKNQGISQRRYPDFICIWKAILGAIYSHQKNTFGIESKNGYHINQITMPYYTHKWVIFVENMQNQTCIFVRNWYATMKPIRSWCMTFTKKITQNHSGRTTKNTYKGEIQLWKHGNWYPASWTSSYSWLFHYSHAQQA